MRDLQSHIPLGEQISHSIVLLIWIGSFRKSLRRHDKRRRRSTGQLRAHSSSFFWINVVGGMAPPDGGSRVFTAAYGLTEYCSLQWTLAPDAGPMRGTRAPDRLSSR